MLLKGPFVSRPIEFKSLTQISRAWRCGQASGRVALELLNACKELFRLLCFHRKLAHITLPLGISGNNELSCVLLFENLDWICFEPSEHEDCFRWMRRLAAMRRASRTLERMLIDGTVVPRSHATGPCDSESRKLARSRSAPLPAATGS
jgi:hypothetical protein